MLGALPLPFDVDDDTTVVEELHDGHWVTVRRRRLRLAASEHAPPLGLWRTTLPEGAHRCPVLLVHGLAQNHRSFRIGRRSFSAALAERGHDVFNLDLRGHGLSRRLGAPPARAVADYVTDITRVVPELPAAPVALGHSLGAAVLVRSAPKVELAGFIHAAGVYTFAGRNRLLRNVARASKVVDRIIPDKTNVNVNPVGRVLARIPRTTRLGNRAFFGGWADRGFDHPMLGERLARGFDSSGWGIWAEMSRWALGEPLDPGGAFGRLDLPLLVLSGEADKLAHPEDARACYGASRSSDKTLVVFNRKDHGFSPGHIDILIGDQAPDVVWPVVFDWLDGR